ncbi:MAG: EndoU domain-containing protein, partial [Patescibacteria group bacterium]
TTLVFNRNLLGSEMEESDYSNAIADLGLTAVFAAAASMKTIAKSTPRVYNLIKALRVGTPEIKTAARGEMVVVANIVKNTDDLLKAAQNVAKTYGFPEDAMIHTLNGAMQADGRVVGWHYKGLGDGLNSVVKIDRAVKPNGVYEATVKIQGILKDTKSTFFPDNWTPQQIAEGIKEVMKNGKIDVLDPVAKQLLVNGVEIRVIYTNASRTIFKTAYPIY